MNNKFIDSLLEKINDISDKYKNVFPLILILPTLIGGLWQMLELIFIDPSFIRFFSISQLISDGILILSILSIFGFYIYFLDKHFDFKDLMKFDLSKKFNISQFIGSLVLILFTSLYYYNVVDDLGFDHILNSQIGKLLVELLLAGVFLPLLLKGILVFSHEILILLFFSKRELKVKHLREFKNRKGTLYCLVHFVSTLLMIFSLIFIIFSIITLIEFRNKVIYPQNLANLQNIYNEVYKEFGKKQKTSILYFNDKFIFVELYNEKNDKKNPSLIKIYKTDDILFK